MHPRGHPCTPVPQSRLLRGRVFGHSVTPRMRAHVASAPARCRFVHRGGSVPTHRGVHRGHRSRPFPLKAVDRGVEEGVTPALRDPQQVTTEDVADATSSAPVTETESFPKATRVDTSSHASTSAASTDPGSPWARNLALGVCASVVVWLGLGMGMSDGPSRSASAARAHGTGAPSGATCGDFSENRTKVAREILTCNQDNWRQNCLSHYSTNVQYVDGPGLTKVFGKKNMATYLTNQFAFSNQWLTVTDETCALGTYVAQWSLDMDLGTGSLVDMPGISVLKFAEGGDGDLGTTSGDAPAEELVTYHRDYLPDGKIWEQAPIVGPLVKFQRETYMGCMLSKGGCAELLGAPK